MGQPVLVNVTTLCSRQGPAGPGPESTDVKFEGARSVFQWTGAFPAVLPSEQFVYAGRSGLP